MEIIQTSHDDLSKAKIYMMTKSPAVLRMSDIPLDEEITCSAFCVYEEEDFKDPNTTNTILSVYDETTNCCYATNSFTFRKAFSEIVDIFGNDGFTFKVMQGTSKNDRNYITAVFQREV